MNAFASLRDLPTRRIWDGIVSRSVDGGTLGLAVVELDPGAVADTHQHPHEQLGLLLEGAVTFTVGDETRELGPGDTWSIPPDTPHKAVAGPEGAVLVDVFAPPREDWRALGIEERAPRWPR